MRPDRLVFLPPPAPPAMSWWVGLPDRQAFVTRAAAERDRTTASKGASLVGGLAHAASLERSKD